MNAASGNKGRFIIWPTGLAVCFPMILILIWAGPFDLAFFGAPFLLMIWSCAVLAALGIAIFSFSKCEWKRAVSALILPLVTLVAVVKGDAVWSFAIDTGEKIHFQVMRRSYLDDVSKLPRLGEPRFAMWNWGGFVVGHGVVYDESDEIALPEQSPAWKKRVENSEVGCGAWGTPLGDHFYLVRTGC